MHWQEERDTRRKLEQGRGLTATLEVNCCTRTSGFGPVEGSGKLSCPSMVFFARVCTCVTSDEACMDAPLLRPTSVKMLPTILFQ